MNRDVFEVRPQQINHSFTDCLGMEMEVFVTKWRIGTVLQQKGFSLILMDNKHSQCRSTKPSWFVF